MVAPDGLFDVGVDIGGGQSCSTGAELGEDELAFGHVLEGLCSDAHEGLLELGFGLGGGAELSADWLNLAADVRKGDTGAVGISFDAVGVHLGPTLGRGFL